MIEFDDHDFIIFWNCYKIKVKFRYLWSYYQSSYILCTSQCDFPGTPPPPMGNSGDSDKLYLTHTGESDSLILTHSGNIWKKINPGDFWPQFERITAYFLAFFIYFLSIPTLSPRDFLTGNSLCVLHMLQFLYLYESTCVWFTTPIQVHFDINNIYIHLRAEIHLWQGIFVP